MEDAAQTERDKLIVRTLLDTGVRVGELTLAQILGHSSLGMIQNVYAHVTPADSYDVVLKVFADN